MSDRPEFWGTRHSERFADASIIAAYRYRPPYSATTIAFLSSLITDEPRNVLDIGCGPGNLARLLLPHVARMDAVDVSYGMIEAGKALPGGDDPRLRWIVSRAEESPLSPPYALVTAGASLHWMDWDVLLPRLYDAMTPRGHLAIANQPAPHESWSDAIRAIIPRYSTNQGFQPFDLIGELERRGLFRRVGLYRTAPTPLTQSVADYIEWFHSMSSFSRDLMTPDAAAAFGAEIRDAVAPYAHDGILHTHSIDGITWGKLLRK